MFFLLHPRSQTPVCEAYAAVLSDLAAAPRQDAFAMALRDERRPLKKAALEKLKPEAGGAVTPCLVAPLVQVKCSAIQCDLVQRLG